MAETVKGLTISVRIFGTVSGDDGAILKVNENYEQTFSDGTGSGQVGTVWQDSSRSLTATSEDLDLVGTTLKDFQGVGLAFNALKVLYVRNLDEDAGDFFWVGGAAATQITGLFGDVTDKIKAGPKGILLWVSPVDGITVSSSTDLLKIESVDAAASSYRILAAGDNS
jgi:cytolysin (calcineurin-like family phosphatase)